MWLLTKNWISICVHNTNGSKTVIDIECSLGDIAAEYRDYTICHKTNECNCNILKKN